MTTVSLLRRNGPRPRTTPSNPHTQLDQQPAAGEAGRLRADLASRVFALPDVKERPSAISVPGARALWLTEAAARGPREAFLVGTEFAHLHPAPDWSLHAALPPLVAEQAIEAGWAEVHPVARLGLIPANVVMIYAPRDDREVETVEALVRAAHAFARHGARNVRRAAVGDEGLLRSLRLEALTLAPDAFGSTYERELARTVADWRRWLSPGVVFLLEDAHGARGLVAAAHDPADPVIVELMAMWVQPGARGSGGADALVQAVFDWTRSGGATAVRLQVMQDNLRARRFYERNGFTLTGGTRVREKDQALELGMERTLDPPIERAG
jgi:GNAT superfamily N-acetyltransferase